jgi:nucleotide-binding universal stress UspA family protein
MATSAGIALVGYDGSEGAATAIRQEGSVLAPRRALVVTVWDSVAGQVRATDLGVSIRELAREADEESEARAERVAAEGADHARAAGFDSEPAAVRASPNAWRTLLAKADEIDAPVVVLGNRGLGAVKSALLGSVSSGTLHHSRRPVLVAPSHSADTPSGPSVLGFDGSEPARGAVSAAAELLSVKKAVITTVWIPYTTVTAAGVAGAPAGIVAGGVEQLDREIAERARRTAENGARLASEHGLQASAEATEATSNTSAALLHFAKEQRAAALVVGSHGRGGIGASVLGSVSAQLVHHADRPVLVVPPPPT